MNNQPTTATSRTRDIDNDEDGNQLCQAEGCLLPPSLLSWVIELNGVTLVLWLCHGHGTAATGEQPADAGGEAA